MDKDKLPDYSKYSIDELKEALSSIDEKRFPERREFIIAELRYKGWTTEGEESKPIRKQSTFDKLLLIFCSIFFTILFIHGLVTGQVSPKGGEDYSLEASPLMFYFILSVYVTLTGVSVFELGRGILRENK